jgi:hypothetical protein
MVALRVERDWGSHIFRHSAHRWRQGSQPYSPATFYPQKKFLVLISVRGWVDPRGIVRLEGLGKLKKKKSTSSGLRTGDIPACSIVPQATTLPRAPWRKIIHQETKSQFQRCSLVSKKTPSSQGHVRHESNVVREETCDTFNIRPICY